MFCNFLWRKKMFLNIHVSHSQLWQILSPCAEHMMGAMHSPKQAHYFHLCWIVSVLQPQRTLLFGRVSPSASFCPSRWHYCLFSSQKGGDRGAYIDALSGFSIPSHKAILITHCMQNLGNLQMKHGVKDSQGENMHLCCWLSYIFCNEAHHG